MKIYILKMHRFNHKATDRANSSMVIIVCMFYSIVCQKRLKMSVHLCVLTFCEALAKWRFRLSPQHTRTERCSVRWAG